MAGLRSRLNAAEVTTSTATLSILQAVAPSNQRILIKQWGISFKGTTNANAPVLVQLVEHSTAGTSVALTPVKESSGDAETLQITARETFSSTEPTLVAILEEHEVHPQGGIFVMAYPKGDEVTIKGSGRVAIRVVTPGAAVACVAHMRCEE